MAPPWYTLSSGEWVSFFLEEYDVELIWVFRIQRNFRPKTGYGQLLPKYLKVVSKFMVGAIMKPFKRFEWELPLEEEATAFGGWFFPVWLEAMTKAPEKTHVHLLYMKNPHLILNPMDWRWGDASNFLSYSFKKGGGFLDDSRQHSKSIASNGMECSPIISSWLETRYALNLNL